MITSQLFLEITLKVRIEIEFALSASCTLKKSKTRIVPTIYMDRFTEL